MAPNPRVLNAFRAMRSLGIIEEKVKPVLKKLLKLYDKNWELIEEENYRALADAIFEQEDELAEEQKKKHENTDQVEIDEEAQVHEESERPLKRLRLRYQEGNSSPRLGGTSLRQLEEAELPETCPRQGSQDITQSSQPNTENVRAGSLPHSPQPLVRNKGKQPVLPKPLRIQEPSQAGCTDRTQPFGTRVAESDSVSPPLRLRDKGKEPLSQIAPKDKKSISERSPHAVPLKEPKLEPGVVHLPKQKMHNSRSLIKPKDEPFTDDMPQVLVPIRVIHPEALSKENSSSGNGSIREASGPEPLALQSEDGEDQSDEVPGLSAERRTNRELANIVVESSSKLQIASSPSGEVKISLTCNSTPGRTDFHMPRTDALLKMVEDKCLRSYKILDPSFSVTKIMEDMCECFLVLGTDSANGSQETIDVTTAVDLLKQSSALDAMVASNGSARTLRASEAPLSQIPRLPPPSSEGVADCTQTDKSTTDNICEIDKEQNGIAQENSPSLLEVERSQLTPGDLRSLHDVNDIAKGQERVVIALVNEVNNDHPPSFRYVPQNVVFQNAYVNFSLARIGENCCSLCLGDCLSSTTPCACAHETGGEYAYTSDGLVKEEFLDECISMNRDPQKHCTFYCKECPLERSKNDDILEPCKGHLVRKFIKECWWKCGCSKQCGNRVVQRGINCKLQVFMTPGGKGWGLRTLQDLPKGAFVCEYVGEILTNAELYERVSQSSSGEEHAYPVLLDADWGSEVVLKDEEALCLDATHYGNVARFINHRCFDSTLVEIPVEVETPDHHYYHLAFFTTRKVKAMEELTWDYGIDFDDHDHPVKAFKCRCGSRFCRNIKRSSRTRSGARR
ncbi:Inactive histone-lysine N-methyltransferase [Actinidia chinensis var. chinensis]|uniref:Inactive histone-lysine N-methyltransferase n=1 Tax=Actinidia chinensis var. chinensis TaxID=1590841 RepID=A0A2R6PEA2_ACTCC|nr:Inactive histone-lysine N-methyltransferase [Actinidia chinensis var. chinensis]